MEKGNRMNLDRGFNVKAKKVFLHEAGEYVGPFESREDAERFLILIEWFGGSRAGITVVERSAELIPRRRKALANPAGFALFQNCRR
jgi:hypothetical protein